MNKTRSALIARQHELRNEYGRNPSEAITIKRVRTMQTASTETIPQPIRSLSNVS